LDSSDWSIVFSFNTILQAPVLIFPTYNQKGVDLDLELLWSKFDSDETFDLQVADNIDFQNPILDMKNINSDKYLLKNLENNKKYFWRLILNIGNKKSDWTDISTFTTEMVKPEIISPNPNQTNVPIQVQLKWNDINVNNFYRIQIALDSIFSNILIDESNLTQKEYEVNLNSMTVYYFRVKTENEMNFSDWSEIIEFKTLDVASVLDSEINSINVFPNPARNFLIINQNDISMGSDAGEILIINSIGNTILRINQFKTNSDNIKIDISSLPNGIYFIRLNKFYGKFIKN
jgi:hypothetical protein